MAQPTEILIVEDNPADLELALHHLKRRFAACQVQVARDGEEALDFLFRRGPFRHVPFEVPRVVFLDLKLPKVDGLGVLRALRENEQTARIPVVVLSSSREEEDIVASYNLHVNSYVQKPVEFDKFRSTIEQLGSYWLAVNEAPGT